MWVVNKYNHSLWKTLVIPSYSDESGCGKRRSVARPAPFPILPLVDATSSHLIPFPDRIPSAPQQSMQRPMQQEMMMGNHLGHYQGQYQMPAQPQYHQHQQSSSSQMPAPQMGQPAPQQMGQQPENNFSNPQQQQGQINQNTPISSVASTSSASSLDFPNELGFFDMQVRIEVEDAIGNSVCFRTLSFQSRATNSRRTSNRSRSTTSPSWVDARSRSVNISLYHNHN